MGTIRYLALTAAFFGTAGFVCALGLVFAPYAFLGSITSQSEVRAAFSAPTERTSLTSPLMPPLTSPSSLLLGSKPEVAAQGFMEGSDRRGNWVEVVDAVNMRSGASSAEPVINVQLEGTRLRVVSRDDNWINVVEPESEQRGWVYNKYVRSVEPALKRARVADAAAE
jgi:uncharacterized protein YgiM (DUF1202 family)